MVSRGQRAATVGPVHGVCMLSYCTSCQQLVTVSFQNWVPVCNAVMIALALERGRDPLREFIYHL